MYVEHPAFESPADENAKIWRYLDFTKFVALLDRRALSFARVDQLTDQFEGSLTKADVETLREDLRRRGFPVVGLPSELAWFRKRIFVNCWHINNYESAAMWRLYLNRDEGVAVRSTFRRFRDSFMGSEHDVFIGKVKYINYDTAHLPGGNILYPFLHKRRAFEYECELRAVVMKWQKGDKGVGQLGTQADAIPEKDLPCNLDISVDLDVLVEKVYVSPAAPNWFGELVRSIVSRYKLKREVNRSSLAEGPLY